MMRSLFHSLSSPPYSDASSAGLRITLHRLRSLWMSARRITNAQRAFSSWMFRIGDGCWQDPVCRSEVLLPGVGCTRMALRFHIGGRKGRSRRDGGTVRSLRPDHVGLRQEEEQRFRHYLHCPRICTWRQLPGHCTSLNSLFYLIGPR